MKVDETNFRLFKRVSEITFVDYDIIWKDAETIEGYIEDYSLLDMIRDLICEIDRLEEQEESEKWYSLSKMASCDIIKSYN